MEKIPSVKKYPNFDMFYQTTNFENTDFENYEDLNDRRPDAYVGFSNDIFLNPQSFFINSNDDLEWYDE